MADKAIPALTAATTPLDGTEVVHGVQSGNSRKITTLDIAKIPLPIGSEAAAFTLAATDASTYIQVDSGTDIDITVDDSIFSAGDEVTIEQTGAGVLTFVAGSGVTINSRGNRLSTNGQWSVVSLKFITAAAATLFGDLA